MTLDSISEGLSGFIGEAEDKLATPLGAAIGGAVLGAATTGAVYGLTSTVKKSAKKRKKAKKSYSKKKKRSKSYKYARTAGKRRDRSTRRIRTTKNGQPYVILASGKARFISKSSARNSRKRKGGRY